MIGVVLLFAAPWWSPFVIFGCGYLLSVVLRALRSRR